MEFLTLKNFTLEYSDGTESLKDITLVIQPNAINVLFGPAGGGKSSLLRVLNRLNDLATVKRVSGSVTFEGMNVLDPKLNVTELRRKIGIVFSRPMPLPMSIYQNISYGLEVAGINDKKELDKAVEVCTQGGIFVG